jgi:serine/threonine protein kinase
VYIETDEGLKFQIEHFYFQNLFKGKWNGNYVTIKRISDKSPSKIIEFHEFIRENNHRIRNPNIVSLMATCTTKNSLLLLYEYNEAHNLESMIFEDIDDKKLIENSLMKNNICIELTRAVAYLHKLEPPIFHGSIRPINVLIKKSDLSVKLSDFDNEISPHSISDGLYLRRIQQFCSPQHLVDKNKKSSYDDIWTLGCTLFFLFEGIFIWITDMELSDKENIQSISDKMRNKVIPEKLSLMSATNQYLFRNCFSYDQKSQIEILRFLEILENNKS